jgi:predicted nucleic acid-binding protein
MSGTEKSKIHYWDACIYLAWLKREIDAHGEDCIKAIERIAADNFQKKNMIITSTITFVEVLSSSLTEEQERRFRQSFRHHDHITYDVDPPIAMKARDFRQRFHAQGGKTIATPDAIHLATAAIYGAHEFLTLDEGKKDAKHLGLLGLSGHEWIDKLTVSKPTLPPPKSDPKGQVSLFDDPPTI